MNDVQELKDPAPGPEWSKGCEAEDPPELLQALGAVSTASCARAHGPILAAGSGLPETHGALTDELLRKLSL